MGKYDNLNEQQLAAVLQTEGPVLILAGAGSGKTRVLTHRAAFLIEERGVNPWNIMCITFTNKAAGEMRERIDAIVEEGAGQIWVSTFHSACVRILRRYIDRLGYDNNFTIYDAEDSKTVMRDVLKRLRIDTKTYKEKTFLNAISSAKDELISPEEFALRASDDYRLKRQSEVYTEYQKTLKKNNALDFDDLIVKCVELFQADSDVLDSYQERLRYIMVDEYQDTNTAQFRLVQLLAAKYRNLCVVGDDDQSIYKFRGANIQNILSFENTYPDATVIRLEQNYRSTQNILDAANAVIKNNEGRKEKSLWTEKGSGERIEFCQLDSAAEEAETIARSIRSFVRSGTFGYGDCAVLYRTNAQSRVLEERFVTENIPYRIFGGVNFYSRREIKDLLAYLKTIDNAQDDVAVKRIINVPRRGIGATTINHVQDWADINGTGFYEAVKKIEDIPTVTKSAVSKVRPFVALIENMREKASQLSVEDLLKAVLDETGYAAELEESDDEEDLVRLENIDELISKAAAYQETAEDPNLAGFLEEVALVADIDNLIEDSDYVALMTLHSAKGLEFPNVYLAGMEDGLFPGYLTINSDDREELEEERRLCYVGITRAKEHLTITSAGARMTRGETRHNKVSRFVGEIPEHLLSGSDYDRMAAEMRPPLRRNVTSSYNSMKPYSAAAKQFGDVEKLSALNYVPGDRVRHKKFGDGTVTSIVSGGRDFEVTVDFDRAGTKKMFASFANLQKLC